MTTVYYIDTTDSTKAYNLGCNQGTDDRNRAGTQQRLVILAFGTPALSGSTYGVYLSGTAKFASRAQLEPAAEQYARGYYLCTGTDLDSTISLALGETNYGSQVASNATQQGRAWSNFVEDVRDWVGSGGYGTQVYVEGAFDMEVAWNGSGTSLPLLAGFDSINSGLASYDYGSADGCPSSGRGNCVAGSHSWSLDQRYQAAWGNFDSYSIPQIYTPSGSQAVQWGNITRYGSHQYNAPIQFSGSLTQQGACNYDVAHGDSNPCMGTDNSPGTGWNQLYYQANQEAGTAMSPQYSDDITWEA